jgi:lysozyme
MDTLLSGSQGADVKRLQALLSQAGYPVTADGLFGPGTQAAVMQFQKDHNLTADGIAGPNTLAALNGQAPSGATVTGIDLSHNNGKVNFAALAGDAGFVFCKASQGAGFQDPMCSTYMKSLSNAGIIRGVYHFLTFQATAEQQIANFMQAGIDFQGAGMLPPVLDVEWQVPDTLNPYILANRNTCIQLIQDWLEGVTAKTGRTPIIYTNRNFWHDYLGNPPGFSQYPLWIAAYQSAPPILPPGWATYAFWQYSEKGTIASVAGQVDMNHFNGTAVDLKKLALQAV